MNIGGVHLLNTGTRVQLLNFFAVCLKHLVLVLRTKKLGEREHKAQFPSQGKGHNDDDDFVTPLYTNTMCMAISE